MCGCLTIVQVPRASRYLRSMLLLQDTWNHARCTQQPEAASGFKFYPLLFIHPVFLLLLLLLPRSVATPLASSFGIRDKIQQKPAENAILEKFFSSRSRNPRQVNAWKAVCIGRLTMMFEASNHISLIRVDSKEARECGRNATPRLAQSSAIAESQHLHLSYGPVAFCYRKVSPRCKWAMGFEIPLPDY